MMNMGTIQIKSSVIMAMTTISLMALGLGCSVERYYCDDTGCYYCDGLSCREAGPPPGPVDCQANTDCADGLLCIDGTCEADPRACGELGCDCSATGECAAGFVCASGECRPEDEVCRFNHQCGADRLCIDGACVAACDEDRACPEGQACTEGRRSACP